MFVRPLIRGRRLFRFRGFPYGISPIRVKPNELFNYIWVVIQLTLIRLNLCMCVCGLSFYVVCCEYAIHIFRKDCFVVGMNLKFC